MATLTIQPSNIDTYLNQLLVNTNYGSEAELRVRSYYVDSNYGNQRSILKFDFSALPAGAVISAAVLSLYKWLGSVGRTYWAYELTQTGWVELEATWNIYKALTNWAAAGGDYTTTDGASQTAPASNNWMDFNVLALVQHFQSAHAEVAHFLVKDGTENSVGGEDIYIRSSNYTTDLSLRPKLVVTYTVAAPSPSISPSISPSVSPSLSPSASISPSASPSVSPSISPSASPSLSPSASISPSESPSLSPSASVSPSVSPSASPSEIPGEADTDYLFQQDLIGCNPQVFPTDDASYLFQQGLGGCKTQIFPIGNSYYYDKILISQEVQVYV